MGHYEATHNMQRQLYRMYRGGKWLSDDERHHVIACEQKRVKRVIKRFLAGRTPVELRPTTAAIVYLNESIHESIHSSLDVGRDARKMKTGCFILKSSDLSRCLILIASLEALARAPLTAPSWEVNVICALRFVYDYHWGGLIKAILRTRLSVDNAFVTAVLHKLSNLADRFDSKFPMNTYEFPFATIIRFIKKHIAVCSHNEIAPAAKELLDNIKKAVAHDLVSIKGYNQAQALSLAAKPELWFTKTDRIAVETIIDWVSTTSGCVASR